MRLNENMVLIGKVVILVPYKKHHVIKYHNWMKSKELLEKTASEPLTLNEEFEMQEKWWKDEDKCTFILLNKTVLTNNNQNNKNIFDSLISRESELSSLTGDVNMFLNLEMARQEAELEVMVAEAQWRGIGLGKEAIKILIYFAILKMNIKKFIVKIGSTNLESLALFKGLGFEEESYSSVFDETTLFLCSSNDRVRFMVEEVKSYVLEKAYDSWFPSNDYLK